jgi:hypothetical protein
MSQLLSVGAKVVVIQSQCSHTLYESFKDSIGTIKQVVTTRASHYYIIDWDKPTSHTYKTRENPNQFNISAHKLKLYAAVDKKQLICNKVLQLQKKFNERKLAHDF